MILRYSHDGDPKGAKYHCFLAVPNHPHADHWGRVFIGWCFLDRTTKGWTFQATPRQQKRLGIKVLVAENKTELIRMVSDAWIGKLELLTQSPLCEVW